MFRREAVECFGPLACLIVYDLGKNSNSDGSISSYPVTVPESLIERSSLTEHAKALDSHLLGPHPGLTLTIIRSGRHRLRGEIINFIMIRERLVYVSQHRKRQHFEDRSSQCTYHIIGTVWQPLPEWFMELFSLSEISGEKARVFSLSFRDHKCVLKRKSKLQLLLWRALTLYNCIF